MSNLNKKQFLPMTPEQKEARNTANAERHAELAPMKETIRSQGASYSSVAGHLSKNSHVLFGQKMTWKDTLAWAVRKHRENPENFLKNIGFTQ